MFGPELNKITEVGKPTHTVVFKPMGSNSYGDSFDVRQLQFGVVGVRVTICRYNQWDEDLQTHKVRDYFEQFIPYTSILYIQTFEQLGALREVTPLTK